MSGVISFFTGCIYRAEY